MKVNARAGRGGKELDGEAVLEILRSPQLWAEFQETIKALPVQRRVVIDHFNSIPGITIAGLGDSLVGEWSEFSAKFMGLDEAE